MGRAKTIQGLGTPFFIKAKRNNETLKIFCYICKI